MGKRNQVLGQWGEEQAAQFLEAQGYQILQRNYRTAYGEIDLIASKAASLVFVEVKARSSDQFGFPEEAVGPKKQQHLIESAQAYLQAHPDFEGDWRIDVVAVTRGTDREPNIHHIENAVS